MPEVSNAREPGSARFPAVLGGDPEALRARKAAVEGLSGKGLRTRRKVLQGAQRVFEKKGSYLETRISDIVKESGVAYGTFYTYFESKEELFYELAVDVVQQMYAEGTSSYRGQDPVKRIDASNRQFLESYRRHAAMMTLIEQAAAVYPDFRGLRRQLRQVFVDRIAANLQRLREAGHLDGGIHPLIAAHALVSMTDNFGYLWFVLGEPFDTDRSIATLTRLWSNGLGLTSGAVAPLDGPKEAPGGAHALGGEGSARR